MIISFRSKYVVWARHSEQIVRWNLIMIPLCMKMIPCFKMSDHFRFLLDPIRWTRLKRLILGSRKKIINLDYRLDRLDKLDRLIWMSKKSIFQKWLNKTKKITKQTLKDCWKPPLDYITRSSGLDRLERLDK